MIEKYEHYISTIKIYKIRWPAELLCFILLIGVQSDARRSIHRTRHAIWEVVSVSATSDVIVGDSQSISVCGLYFDDRCALSDRRPTASHKGNIEFCHFAARQSSNSAHSRDEDARRRVCVCVCVRMDYGRFMVGSAPYRIQSINIDNEI